MKFPSGISCILILFATPALAEGPPWSRHAIDASSRGADGVRLADVNGDGRPDIVTGWEEGARVKLYLHPGPARVREPWPGVTVGEVKAPEDAVLADLDGDGRLDVVSSCEGSVRSVHVHWAPADPAARLESSAWVTETLPACRNLTRWMFAVPLQADGLHGIDLVLGSKDPDGRIALLVAPEKPRRLERWRRRDLRRAGWIMSIRARDLDGDGDPDLVFSDRKGPRRGIAWLEHPGHDAVRRGDDWPEHRVLEGREVMFLDLGDLDGDGRLDIACAVRGGPFVILRGSGDRGREWDLREIPVPPGCGTGKGVAIGDVDLDGRADLIFSCENATGGKSGVRWLRRGGSVEESSWADREISGPEGIKFDRLELLDLDGDGDLDVLTCEERDNLGVIWYENPTRG